MKFTLTITNKFKKQVKMVIDAPLVEIVGDGALVYNEHMTTMAQIYPGEDCTIMELQEP
jgi:hypothetical protein